MWLMWPFIAMVLLILSLAISIGEAIAERDFPRDTWIWPVLFGALFILVR